MAFLIPIILARALSAEVDRLFGSKLRQNKELKLSVFQEKPIRLSSGAAVAAPASCVTGRKAKCPLCHAPRPNKQAGPASRRALAGADWDGALWFAGEAASEQYFGTAHGAVLSGRAAAKAVLAGR
ncbi:MAG: FAD-dependent oxidoreductase [Roseinatronobacter sp.]|nr:FAD-dependent oxidoreductase [Roseinatronobacter sp.]